MNYKTLKEYAPTLCATCPFRNVCTERLRNRNKRLVIFGCGLTKIMYETQCFILDYKSKEFTDWGEKYNEFFSGICFKSKEEFSEGLIACMNGEYFAFADTVIACYEVFSDAVLKYVDLSFLNSQKDKENPL